MSYFTSGKERRILLIGLDSAGKTTILYKLKLDETVSTVPTLGFNVESVQVGKTNFTVWDVGGQDSIRRLWKHYYQGTQAVIFVVDSNDKERIGKAQEALHASLNDEELRDAVGLVFANKQDLPRAMTPAQVTEGLMMHNLPQKKWYIQSTCATTGEGLTEGFKWLDDVML